MFISPLAEQIQEGQKQSPLADSLARFVNKAIEQELRKYFIDEGGYDKILPGEDELLLHCPISNEEIALVDVDKLYCLFPAESEMFFPDYYLMWNKVDDESNEDFAEDMFYEVAIIFVAKKFIQLVKLVKSEKLYTPDLFLEALLCLISEEAYLSEECFIDGKEELKADLAEYYIGGSTDETIVEENTEMINEASYNLNSIFETEKRNEIGWLLWDSDYTALIEGDFKLFAGLLTMDPLYDPYYVRSIYISVDECVPFTVEKAIEFSRNAQLINKAISGELPRQLRSYMKEAFACEDDTDEENPGTVIHGPWSKGDDK